MITKNKMTTNYTVEIDKTKYYFEDLELKENAIGKMSLPYQTIDKIYLSVAADILSDREKELNYAELAFIAKRIPLSMSEIANLIKKNKSTISKWKEKDNIPYDTSFVIKQKLSEIIFEGLLR